jgi:hypothetical protein
MEIDQYRSAHFHVTVRWKLGGEARDPAPEDVHAVLAEGLNARLGLHEVLELDVTKIPVSEGA